MKVFLTAAVAAIVLAYSASVLLDRNWQESAATAYTTPSVRVGNPGSNLVGADWPAAAASAEEG